MSESAIAFAEGGGIYQKLVKDVLGGDYILRGGGVVGDNVTVEDVLIDLSSYPKAASAKVKGELVKRIGLAVRKLGAKVSMKNQDTILESVRKYLPDPDKKSTIRANKGKLKDIAKTIAKVINDVFSQSGTVKVINMNQSPERLVQDVATHIWGLSCGTQIEFYKIFGILKSTLNRLEALEVLAQNVIDNKLSQASRGSKSIGKSLEIEEARMAITAALSRMKALTNQLRLATNVLSTDENKMLIQMDRHKDKMNAITTHTDAWDNEDTNKTGDTIARLLSSIGNTALMADIVDNSLKEVSLSMSQFRNFKTFNELLDNVMGKLVKMNPSKDGDKIGTMLYHMDQLKKYFGRRHTIQGGGIFDDDDGSDVSGGEFELLSEPLSSEAPTSFAGGDGSDDDLLEGGNINQLTPEDTTKLAKKRRAELAVKAFVDEMNSQINDFVENVYEASKYLGDTRYDTESVKEAIENMKYIEALRDPNVYLALIGYYTDDSYRMLSAQYKDRLEKTVRSFKELGKKLPAARKPLDAAANNISQIIKKVDFFSDLLKTLLASTSLPDIKDIISHIPASMGNIRSALNRFYHSLHISQMRRNIKISACDLNRYTEDYPELLAWAVGNRRQQLETEYRLLTSDPNEAARMSSNSGGNKLLTDVDTQQCSLVYRYTHSAEEIASEFTEIGKYGAFILSSNKGFNVTTAEIDIKANRDKDIFDKNPTLSDPVKAQYDGDKGRVSDPLTNIKIITKVLK